MIDGEADCIMQEGGLSMTVRLQCTHPLSDPADRGTESPADRHAEGCG